MAVCVLEVLHPKGQGAAAAPAGAPAAAAAGPGPGPAPPRKRQRSMLEYASGSAGGAGGSAGGASSSAGGAPHDLRGMARRYLLVQRPEGTGLLAGLFEFPGGARGSSCWAGEAKPRTQVAGASSLVPWQRAPPPHFRPLPCTNRRHPRAGQ